MEICPLQVPTFTGRLKSKQTILQDLEIEITQFTIHQEGIIVDTDRVSRSPAQQPTLGMFIQSENARSMYLRHCRLEDSVSPTIHR